MRQQAGALPASDCTHTHTHTSLHSNKNTGLKWGHISSIPLFTVCCSLPSTERKAGTEMEHHGNYFQSDILRMTSGNREVL